MVQYVITCLHGLDKRLNTDAAAAVFLRPLCGTGGLRTCIEGLDNGLKSVFLLSLPTINTGSIFYVFKGNEVRRPPPYSRPKDLRRQQSY